MKVNVLKSYTVIVPLCMGKKISSIGVNTQKLLFYILTLSALLYTTLKRTICQTLFCVLTMLLCWFMRNETAMISPGQVKPVAAYLTERAKRNHTKKTKFQ